MTGTRISLAERVLRPLLCGGEVRPIRPIGARRALALANEAVGTFELDHDVQNARLREARRLWPVDGLPALSVAEWLLLAALNDLLQVNNPDLTSLPARKRPRRLLQMARENIVAAAAPKTAAEALARHATFSRVLLLERHDTLVRWWIGERWFIGTLPPRRLTAWPTLRRVHTHKRRVALAEMAGEAPWAADYRDVVTCWLAATPLTQLAHGELTPAALALATHPVGRALLGRAFERSGRVERVLRSARKTTEDVAADAAELVRELEQRVARAG